MAEIIAHKLFVAGQVQGVGFRPFVYRLAHECGVTGWVRNGSGTVEILAQSDAETLRRFTDRLTRNAPPLAVPELRGATRVPQISATRFRIIDSDSDQSADVHLPADQFTCRECLDELLDPANRRYRYPFINCTQCGPRYTIIDRLPYDRVHTSMSGFALCPACIAEYGDPTDRRFHAEPIACPNCGPGLVYTQAGSLISGTEAALRAAIEQLRRGGTVAVRGIGGYHLFCDAENDAAVAALRRRKNRPHKPLAVMTAQAGDDMLAAVRRIASPSAAQAKHLASPRRPIVLCEPKRPTALAAGVAPGLNEVGIFLPYSPLHHLLLNDFGGPLVATSGNISGEPVLTDPAQAETRLAALVDGFLHHDREIRRPADDAVLRVSAGHARPLRLGRGCAPLEMKLNHELARPMLALGGHMKNTICLAWRDRVVISPHIGDLDSPRGLQIFDQVVDDLKRVYNVDPEQLICDAHPQYASSRRGKDWAETAGKHFTKVYHHHAHAAAVYGEFGCGGDLLVFTWDGTGYGEDGTTWGGEGLHGHPGHWTRVSSFIPFRLPGGDRAAREPWRAAAAMCWTAGMRLPDPAAEAPDCGTATAPTIEAQRGPVPQSGSADLGLLMQAWQKHVNAPVSTAAGRLFDAAAYFTGLCARASFEGQAPMWLEAVARGDTVAAIEPLPLRRDAFGCWRADWRELIALCTDQRTEVAERSARFHEKLAKTLVSQARQVRNDTGTNTVGLSGGVFQNRILLERVQHLLAMQGFTVLIPERIPVNDAGLSFGQVVEAAALSDGVFALTVT